MAIDMKIENFKVDKEIEFEVDYFLDREMTADEKEIGRCCFILGYRNALSTLAEKIEDELEEI